MVTQDVIETITRATTELCQMLREHEATITEQDATIQRLRERNGEYCAMVDDKDGLIEGLRHQRQNLTDERDGLQSRLNATNDSLMQAELARTKAESELRRLQDVILNVGVAIQDVIGGKASNEPTNVVPMPIFEPLPIQDERAAASPIYPTGPVHSVNVADMPESTWSDTRERAADPYAKPFIASADPYHGEPIEEPKEEVKEPSDPFDHVVNF